MAPPSAVARRPRLEALLVVFAVAFTASLLDFVLSNVIGDITYEGDVALLVFAVLLVSSHPNRSGITLGTTTNHRKALTVCAFIIGGVLAYRFILDGDAFDNWNTTWTVWAISPVAQELIFSGFILGLLNEHYPRWWHQSIPVSTAVVVSAALFGMWHFIPDVIFGNGDLSWLVFRQAYTAIPWILYAMTRLWTGTVLYAVITHMAVNFIILGL